MSDLEWQYLQSAMILVFAPMVGWALAVTMGLCFIAALLEIVRDFGNWLNHLLSEAREE